MSKLFKDKVFFQKLNRVRVQGGDILHALKKSDSSFKGFGEAYFSIIKSGIIKGWKLHKKMTCNLIVPIGEVEFIITNNLRNFDKHILCEKKYGRLTIPPNFWFAFKGKSNKDSLVLNIADREHDSAEYYKKDIKEIDYDWRD